MAPDNGAGGPVVNAMTIDVEDYFHVSVFDGLVPRHRWEQMESRVCANTERLLNLFDETGVMIATTPTTRSPPSGCPAAHWHPPAPFNPPRASAA